MIIAKLSVSAIKCGCCRLLAEYVDTAITKVLHAAQCLWMLLKSRYSVNNTIYLFCWSSSAEHHKYSMTSVLW